MRQTVPLLLPALVVAAIGATARSQTIHFVDDDAPPGGDGLSWATAHDTLPPALTAAQPGDQLWVAAGTYAGNFTLALEVEMYGGFAGNETELAQRDWTINETILDANDAGTVVTAPPGATETTRIDGFTITNGNETNGGGMSASDSSPTIANNNFTNSFAVQRGGGLYLSGSAAIIEGNTFSGNHAVDVGGGGGVYLIDSSPTIRDNAIINNTVGHLGAASAPQDDHAPRGTGAIRLGPPPGAGLYLGGNSSPLVVNNVISGNQGALSGGGITVRVSAGSSPTITGNTISGNTARFWGGGLEVNPGDSASATITHNTIIGNSLLFGGGGGGLYVSGSATVANNMVAGNTAINSGGGLYIVLSSATFANNTVVGNTAGDGGGLAMWLSASLSPAIANNVLAFNSSGVYQLEEGIPTLSHNCVYGNTAYDYAGLPDPTGTDGNVSLDPALIRIPDPGPDGLWGTADDDYGDVSLAGDSACIDAGDNAEVPPDTADLDGDGNTTEPMPLDFDGYPRFTDILSVPDTGSGTPPIVDIGAYEVPDCDAGGAGGGADCQPNGIFDACDIAAGTSQDCNSDSIPDECQLDEDCNANGVRDICDIAVGNAVDCTANLRPDACDIADGVSADTNANGVPDECEARLMPDSASNLAGTVKTCANHADCRIGMAPDSHTYCIQPPSGSPDPGICYVAKNRYIGFEPSPADPIVAVRIKLDLGAGATALLGWAGPPQAVNASGGNPGSGGPEVTPQWLTRIEDAPHYRRWGRDDAGAEHLSGTTQIGDCEISNGQMYFLQSIPIGLDTADEANYAEQLELSTVTFFGDVVGGTIGLPPDNFRSFKDISAVVRAFQGVQREPKVWLDLHGSIATPEVPDFGDINFTDINAAIAGFEGADYPFAAPCDCPGQSCQ